MSRSRRITLIVGVILLVTVVVGFLGLWYVLKQQPAWYREQAKIEAKSPESREAGQEMEQGIAQVVSGFEKSGKWEIVFTEKQINGYLAATLATKHPDLLPPELHNPRVKIESDGLILAARVESPVDMVVSLKVDVYLPRPSTIAVRVRRIRLGLLPWPLGSLVKEISNAAEQAGVLLSWTRSDQDPVALITVVSSDPKKLTQITACQLEDGKLYLAGTTRRKSNDQ